MDYKDLIRNWHKKARSQKDFFSKYVFEYLAFIAHLKIHKYSSNDTDRQSIQKLKGESELKDRYLQKISETPELKKSWQKIKAEFDNVRLGNASRNLNEVEEIEWWNCSQDNPNQKSDEEKRRLKGVIHSLDDWENMVEFWHSIRNNLFHGAKNPENERDQFAVKYGYLTLKELMEIFLHEEN